MRKGLTLIEILISMVIVSILIATLVNIHRINFTVFTSISEDKIAIDNLRNIEEIIARKINNAETMEILENIPQSFEQDYNYIYSDVGEVYHVDENGYVSEITDNSEEIFETTFTKNSSKVLDLEVDAIKSGNKKTLDIQLKNLRNNAEILGVETSNVIKYTTNLSEKISSDVTLESFVFKRDENDEVGSNIWPQDEYVGIIDEDNREVVVTVDYQVNISSLKPTVEHTGDEEFYNDISIGNNYFSFNNNVSLKIRNNQGLSIAEKEYDIIVRQVNQPRLNNFYFEKSINNLNDDRIGFINQSVGEVYITVHESSSIGNLIPSFDIIGDYVEIEGQRLNEGDLQNFDFTNPVNLSVYEYMADGITKNKRLYTIYVTSEPYLSEIFFEDENGVIFVGEVDEDNLNVVLPTHYDDDVYFYSNYSGNKVELKGTEGLILPINVTKTLANVENKSTQIIKSDKINKGDFDKEETIVVSNEISEKEYNIILMDTILWNLYYENTGSNNPYLYKDKVNAVINHGDSQRARGEIVVTMPQNEYLEEMKATFNYLGDSAKAGTNINDNFLNNNQISNFTKTNINELTVYGIDGLYKYLVGFVPFEDEITKFYDFKLEISELPRIELIDTKLEMILDEYDEVLSVSNYNYIQGENREEKSNSTEYKWYYVTEEESDKVGTGKGIILDCDTKDFKIKDYENQFIGAGYVYAGVRTRSETYEVNNVEYGGVYTEWVYTEGYEVDYNGLSIVPYYTIFGANTEGVSINISQINMNKNDNIVVHSNSDIKFDYNALNGVLNVSYVGEAESSHNNIGSDVIIEKVDEPIETPNYHQFMEESIDLVGDNVYSSNNININLTKETVDGEEDNVKTWIEGENIYIEGSGKFIEKAQGIKSNGGLIQWNATARGIGTKEYPLVIYQEGGGTININGKFNNDNYVFIYAPDSTVNITDTFTANASIIAKNLNVTDLFKITHLTRINLS